MPRSPKNSSHHSYKPYDRIDYAHGLTQLDSSSVLDEITDLLMSTESGANNTQLIDTRISPGQEVQQQVYNDIGVIDAQDLQELFTTDALISGTPLQTSSKSVTTKAESNLSVWQTHVQPSSSTSGVELDWLSSAPKTNVTDTFNLVSNINMQQSTAHRAQVTYTHNHGQPTIERGLTSSVACTSHTTQISSKVLQTRATTNINDVNLTSVANAQKTLHTLETHAVSLSYFPRTTATITKTHTTQETQNVQVYAHPSVQAVPNKPIQITQNVSALPKYAITTNHTQNVVSAAQSQIRTPAIRIVTQKPLIVQRSSISQKHMQPITRQPHIVEQKHTQPIEQKTQQNTNIQRLDAKQIQQTDVSREVKHTFQSPQGVALKQVVDAQTLLPLIQTYVSPLQQKISTITQQMQQIQQQNTALQQQLMCMQKQQTHNTMLIQSLQQTLITMSQSNSCTSQTAVQSVHGTEPQTRVSSKSDDTSIEQDYDTDNEYCAEDNSGDVFVTGTYNAPVEIDVQDNSIDKKKDYEKDNGDKNDSGDEADSAYVLDNAVTDAESKSQSVCLDEIAIEPETSITTVWPSYDYSLVRDLIYNKSLRRIEDVDNTQTLYLKSDNTKKIVEVLPPTLHTPYFMCVDMSEKHVITVQGIHASERQLVKYTCTQMPACNGCRSITSLKKNMSESAKRKGGYNMIQNIRIHGLCVGSLCMPLAAHIRMFETELSEKTTFVHSNSISFLRHIILNSEENIYAHTILSVCRVQEHILKKYPCPAVQSELESIRSPMQTCMPSRKHEACMTGVFQRALAIMVLEDYKERCVQRESNTNLVLSQFLKPVGDTRLITLHKKTRLIRDLEHYAGQIVAFRQCAQESGNLLMMLANKPALSWLYLEHDLHDIIEETFNNTKNRYVLDVSCATEVVARMYSIAEHMCSPKIFYYDEQDTVIQASDILCVLDTQTHEYHTCDIETLVSEKKLAECKKEYLKAMYNRIQKLCKTDSTYSTFLSEYNVPQVHDKMNVAEVDDALHKITDGLVNIGFTRITHSPNRLQYNHYTDYESYSQSSFLFFVDANLGYTTFATTIVLAQVRNSVLCSLYSLCIKLDNAKMTQEQFRKITQEFDDVFVMRSYRVLQNMQLVNMKHLHCVADYAQRFVGIKKILTCFMCEIFDIGHYATHDNDETECLSYICLESALNAIMSMMPHALFEIHYKYLMNNLISISSRVDFERLLVEYLYVQYTAPKEIEKDKLTTLEKLYLQHDLQFEAARASYLSRSGGLLEQLMLSLNKKNAAHVTV